MTRTEAAQRLDRSGSPLGASLFTLHATVFTVEAIQTPRPSGVLLPLVFWIFAATLWWLCWWGSTAANKLQAVPVQADQNTPRAGKAIAALLFMSGFTTLYGVFAAWFLLNAIGSPSLGTFLKVLSVNALALFWFVQTRLWMQTFAYIRTARDERRLASAPGTRP